LDLDSDNDGIADLVESGDVRAADANRDGMADGIDDDGDGIVSTADQNDSEFGILGLTAVDLERDGKYSYLDLDSDGDGLADAVEAGYTAGVSISNGLISGAKTSGWANTAKALYTTAFTFRNTDGRGAPDYLDIDSDDDGIQDNVEGQPTSSFKVAAMEDTDGDGLVDAFDINATAFGAAGITPYDLDGDGTPDYRDSDTDNDGAPDINEGSKYFDINQNNINTGDADGDGLLDEFDGLDLRTIEVANLFVNVSNSNMGTNGSFDGPTPSGALVKLVKTETIGDRDWRNNRILPLQIISFTGTLMQNNAVLTWRVENEQEVDYYEVESSTNGRDFNKIGVVKPLNSTNKVYNYKDNLDNYNSATIYYRIKQVNKARETFVSNVVIFRLTKKVTELSVFPNPVVDVINVKIASISSDEADIRLMSMSGQVMLIKKAQLQVGLNQVTIPNVGHISKGAYILQVRIKDQVWSERLIKQ
jgi:hypothetical protein